MTRGAFGSSEKADRAPPRNLIELLRLAGRRAARERLFGKTDPPLMLGRFEVDRPLGAGAVGTVFRAVDPELGRTVAIKVVEPLPEHGEAVRSEAKLLASLSDPNVVTVFEVGVQGALTFLVMEEVDGETLADWLATKPPTRARIEAFLGAARGLSACHRCGIVHRDFKPSNVIMAGDGRPRIVDFGLALREVDAEHASWGGTLRFMAPEQLAHDRVTSAADLFAFCVALYRALTGRDPFGDADGETRLAAMRRGSVDVSEIAPKRLASIVRAGLRFDPADRPDDMEALVEALASAVSPTPRKRIGAVLAATLVAVGAAAVAAYSARPDPRFEGVPGASHPPGARRLLWVDDNPRYNQEEIAELREAGWAVELALTTEEATRAGSFDAYAAILSDMERQNEDAFDPNAGIELIRVVRASGATTPVIIYTSAKLVDVLREGVLDAGGTSIAGTPSALYEQLEHAAGDP